MKIPVISLIALTLALVAACEKKQPTPPSPTPSETPSFPRPAPPERIDDQTPEAILGALHHAAQEMALDGFQFDKADLGWPFDCGASSSSGYLRSLAGKGYLSPQDLGAFENVEITNLSDSDPGETLFAKITHQKKIHLLRKDGRLSIESEEAVIPGIPPREPAWLPK